MEIRRNWYAQPWRILYGLAMQRLFSMFPQGAPGIGLLLLRFSVATMFCISLTNLLAASSNYLVLFFILAITAFLVIGFLTPVISVLACVSAAAALLIYFRWNDLILASAIIDSAALALLGPGAYSLDALLFGRRVMVVSARKDSRRH